MAASFDACKVFYYTAKCGNITHAADALFLSQSTASRMIQNLEAELGCTLFLRKRNGVALTPEGEVLFRHVSAGCEAIFRGEDRLQQILCAQRSQLRVGVSEFLHPDYLLPALTAFSAQFPDVSVSVSSQRHAEGGEAFYALKDGYLNILFTHTPPPESDSYRTQRVCEAHDVLIAGAAFGEFLGRTVGYSELAHCSFAVCTAAGGHDSYLEDVFRQNGVAIRPRYRVDTAALLAPMVRRGLCISAVPEPTYRELAGARDIFALRLAQPLPTREIYALTSKASPPGAPEEELIRCFRRRSPAADAPPNGAPLGAPAKN